MRAIPIALLIAGVAAVAACGVPMVPESVRRDAVARRTIVVYPVHVLSRTSRFDPALGQQIVNHLNGLAGLRAVLAAHDPHVNGVWGMNEARMFTRSFDAFGETARADLSDYQLGLLVELLESSREIDLHYHLVDREGRGVMTALVNSHHPAHKALRPASTADGVALFSRVFDRHVEQLRR